MPITMRSGLPARRIAPSAEPVPSVPPGTRVEDRIGRWKRVIGDALRFPTDKARAAEIAIAVEVLNRMLDPGRPSSVRVA
jgi:hypothetical protein